MASKICCAEDHSTKAISVFEAAVALAEGRPIGACKKCSKPLQYHIDHTYANDPEEKEYEFLVTRAVRLGARLAGDEKIDPFLLVLRDLETGREQILPTFWAFGQTGAHRGGPFAPILGLEEWRRMFRQLDANFEEPLQKIRMRAYELYEKRGRLDGYDLQDWLQAEAEIAGAKQLPVAA
jgi:Protein of unknown function (DUF2934)